MKLEIAWGHTFNVEAREPQLNITIVYEVGGRRIKSEQSFARSIIASMPGGLSIFEVIRVAADAMLRAGATLEDKRRRNARAALLGAARAGNIVAHAGKDASAIARRILH